MPIKLLNNPLTSLVAIMLLLLTSCGDDNEPQPETPPAKVERTVLVYMVADNSLGTDFGSDDEDLREMLKGVKEGNHNGGRLLVYHNRPNTASNPPQLIEVTPSGLKTVKNYKDDPKIYSVDPDRIREVMADMKSIAPAETYGLVLWSHADGWLGPSDSNNDRYRSFGEDRHHYITVQTLARTLSDERFEFVYFDCCLMGNIETLYELRHLAPVMVASPTELSVDGMPYDRNMEMLFSPDVEKAMIQAAKNTYTYYLNNENGYEDGCQIAVYRTDRLDALASASRDIFSTVTAYPSYYDISKLQSFNNWRAPKSVYDMDNYMELLVADSRPDLLAAWRDRLSDVVAYSAYTTTGIGKLEIYRYCGLGSFAINDPDQISWRGYNTLQWWSDAVSVAPAYSQK